MTTTINASTSAGLVITPDTSGNIQLQYNGVSTPAFAAVLTGTTQSISANSYTKAQLGYKLYDTANYFDAATNYRFTPLIAGYYQINCGVCISWNSASPTGYIALLYKNGGVHYYAESRNDSGNPMYGTNTISTLVYMNGSTDYLELYGYSVGGTSVVINGSYSSYTNINTWMNGYLVRGT
jgi:hypothetical protein